MFKLLFYYWLNPTDLPSIVARLNFWAFINIRIFKMRASNIILYFILGLNNLTLKKIRILYKNVNFDLFYSLLAYIIIALFIIINILLLF